MEQPDRYAKQNFPGLENIRDKSVRNRIDELHTKMTLELGQLARRITALEDAMRKSHPMSFR